MSQVTDKSEEKPNRLVSLKALVFLFFGALQCLYAYLPSHMEYLGFTRHEIRTITLIASLVSIIGPLIVGFVLDRVSVKQPANYGKWLRVLLFICFIATGIFFGLLLSITPEKHEIVNKEPRVTFSCDNHGGHLFVKRGDNQTCSNLSGRNGYLKLSNCSYTCELPENFKHLYHPSVVHSKNNPAFERLQEEPVESSSEGPSEEEDYYEKTDTDENLPQPEALQQAPTQAPIISPPHICFNNGTSVNCHVYLDGVIIKLNRVEGIETNENDTNKFSESWCKHPLANFGCNVPERQVAWMHLLRARSNISQCSPAIECLIEDAHEVGSILEETKIIVLQQVPHESYYPLRIIAEIFPIIIHMLLNISIVIATRETSIGRGNIGHQCAFYPIGVLAFASILGLVNHAVTIDQFIIPMVTFCVTMFVCAIIVLFSGKLPLTPSDWWWYTKCGMLAIPMSALKRYKWVITAIAVSAFLLGGFWHVQEAFRHIFTIDIFEEAVIENHAWRSKTFVYVIGALLAIPLIWNGEKIVDCFGHSNIFILAFVSFALRFTGLYYNSQEWTTLYEIFEPISFYLAWLALLLFIHHLVPKKFLALGHGLLVINFFALGRAIGFFFGVSVVTEPLHLVVLNISEETGKGNEIIDLQSIHEVAAIIAVSVATIYFVIYHLILLPRYRVPTNRLVTNNESNVSPQRIFHDERAQKGYFRY